jgi:hypothetical protein
MEFWGIFKKRMNLNFLRKKLLKKKHEKVIKILKKKRILLNEKFKI